MSKVEIVKQFMAAQQAGKFDEVGTLLADDVVFSTLRRGDLSGKAAVVQALQATQAQLGRFNITWSEPAEAGDGVEMSASTMRGRAVQRFSFDGDKISKLGMSMG